MDKRGTEIKFLSIYVEKNMGWFSAKYFNGLFSIDFSTGETKFIGQFPEEKSTAIYRNIIPYKNQLFFTPCRGDVIGVYDKVGDIITCIDIPQSILNKLDDDRFAFSFEYCDSIYAFGLNSSIVLKLDIKTKLFNEIRIFSNSENVKSFSSTSYVLTNENKLYTFVNNAKEVIEITLKDFSYRILKIYQTRGSLISLAKKDDALWITDTIGKLVEYDLKKEKYQKYSIQNVLAKPDDKTGQFAWNLYICEDNIYMIAGINHASYIFDILTKCFKKNDKFEIDPHKKFPFWTNDAGPICFLPIQYNDKVYFQWEADLTLRILDLKNNQLESLPVIVDKKHYAKVLIKQKMERRDFLFETEDEFSLDLFLDTL